MFDIFTAAVQIKFFVSRNFLVEIPFDRITKIVEPLFFNCDL